MYAILAQVGSKGFFSLAMPPIAVSTLSQWEVGARRWRRNHRGQDPLEIGVESRLSSLSARSAFVAAQWERVDRRPDVPADFCRACGCWTSGWCEGCYLRAPLEFSALCQGCDAAHRVCDRCSAAGVTWQAGHDAFEATHGPEDPNTVYISGFGAREGDPAFSEVQDSVSIATLAEQLGISEQAVREYLIHALGGAQAGPADGAGAAGSASRQA